VERPGDRHLRSPVATGAAASTKRRRSIRAAPLVVVLLATALIAAGCGSSGGAETSASGPPAEGGGGSETASTTYLRSVESACRRSVAEIAALAKGLPRVFENSANGNAAVNTGIVREGVRILSSEAARIRAAGPAPTAPPLATFVGLFDPIVELARQRYASGSEEDVDRSHELELIISGLSAEQAAAAGEAGLRPCAVDFTNALGGQR
jgi:hypothetical protein